MSRAVATDCQSVAERLTAYLDGKLDKAEAAEIDAHLAICPACDQSVQCSSAVGGLLDYVQIENVIDNEPEESVLDRIRGTLAAAPWWGISVALHALVLTLAGLLSMSIKMPESEDSVIVVTELQARIAQVEAQKAEQKRDQVLSGEKDVPPTELHNKEQSNILVPPDILQRAELGDHFETINPDRPDTSSAFGTEDSQMFHSASGNDEPAGGGGEGGAALEGLIGVGGPAGAGTGGGFGGGDGTGTGLGKGAGHGSFGNRNGGGRKLMVKRHGGSKATEGSVDMALRWLAYNQEADGHWDATKHGGGMNHGRASNVDSAVTGLATLAFLGAGHTEKVGEYKDNVRRAVAWLISKQRPNGAVAAETDGGSGYTFAITTLALAEAAGMANIKETKEAAQKAVNYCIDVHQHGEGSDKLGWRYSPKSAGDTSVVGWFVMALKSAKVAGLKVDPMSIDGAIRFLDSVESKEQNGSGYPASYYGYTEAGQKGHRTSCIGVLCRQFLGWKKEELESSVELFMTKGGLPKWERLDLYYWYYGTLCTFQQGGEIWKKWNESMKPALIENQVKAGPDAGSWNVVGAFSESWGRVGQTALGALCLEVYYRYAQLTKDPEH